MFPHNGSVIFICLYFHYRRRCPPRPVTRGRQADIYTCIVFTQSAPDQTPHSNPRRAGRQTAGQCSHSAPRLAGGCGGGATWRLIKSGGPTVNLISVASAAHCWLSWMTVVETGELRPRNTETVVYYTLLAISVVFSCAANL